MYVIDKIEGNTAICEHNGEMLQIDISLFDEIPHEGMCFCEENGQYFPLHEREEERREYAESLLNKLFTKNNEEN